CTSPNTFDLTFGSNCSSLTGSKPDMVKAGVAGKSTKSPASRVKGRLPSTAKRQLPSITTHKLGWPKEEKRTPHRPAALMRLEKTARGSSSAMTSERGAVMSGL